MGPKAQAATQTQALNTSSKIKQYVLRAIKIGRHTHTHMKEWASVYRVFDMNIHIHSRQRRFHNYIFIL